MNLPMNVNVYCSDGLCGHSSQVIVDPTNKQVTNLVVKEKQFPHTEYMAPIDQIMDSTPDMIKLRGTIAGLATMDPFIHIDTIYTDAKGMGYSTREVGLTGTLGIGYTTWPQHDAGERFTVTVKTEAVPAGEVALTQGAHIHARDGQIGRLDGFLTVAATGQITHLLLREGHLWGQTDVTIPAAQIDHLEEENVYLKLDKASISALPTTPVRT
jgi:hypothetical protein